jgi:hypothetical protein
MGLSSTSGAAPNRASVVAPDADLFTATADARELDVDRKTSELAFWTARHGR